MHPTETGHPATGGAPIPITRALDGARILYRHWTSVRPPSEGWVREISPNGELVRIAGTAALSDKGTWFRILTLRVDDVLEPGKGGEP